MLSCKPIAITPFTMEQTTTLINSFLFALTVHISLLEKSSSERVRREGICVLEKSDEWATSSWLEAFQYFWKKNLSTLSLSRCRKSKENSFTSNYIRPKLQLVCEKQIFSRLKIENAFSLQKLPIHFPYKYPDSVTYISHLSSSNLHRSRQTIKIILKNLLEYKLMSDSLFLLMMLLDAMNLFLAFRPYHRAYMRCCGGGNFAGKLPCNLRWRWYWDIYTCENEMDWSLFVGAECERF